jgi:hypothetical protein
MFVKMSQAEEIRERENAENAEIKTTTLLKRFPFLN